MAIDFKKYCELYTVSSDIMITEDMTIPEEYVKTVDRVVDDLRYRTEDFDSVTIEYIQCTLDSVEDMGAALRHTEGDIPDGMMNTLSKELYGKMFNELEQIEKSIIITISTYICVAKNRMLV